MYKSPTLIDKTATAYRGDILNFDKAVLTKIARLFTYAAIICLPFSHTFVNQFMVMATLFSILSGRWRWKWQILKTYTPIWISVAFLSLLAITLLHPHVPWHNAGTSFFKYTKILYIPLLLPIFLQAESRRMATNCFLATIVAASALSACIYWLLAHGHPVHFPWLKYDIQPGGTFVNLIDFSVLSAYAIYLFLARCISKQHWLFNLMLATGLCIHLFFVNGEKTGTALFFLLMGLLLWQHLRWKGVIIALIAIPAIIIPSYLFSTQFQIKANEFLTYVHSVAVHAQTSETSTAYRVDFARYSYKIFKENPILGVGIGGFKQAYLAVNGPLLPGAQFLGEPHDTYIYILVEAGLIGLAIYLFWLLSLWIFAFRLLKPEQYFLQALLLAFTFNGITNASITGNTTGTFYVIFIAILFAAFVPKASKP